MEKWASEKFRVWLTENKCKWTLIPQLFTAEVAENAEIDPLKLRIIYPRMNTDFR
jgi:hypothetical protein